MAKTKNLAILAGLAGLAYANRDKLGFGSKDKDKSKSSGMTPEQNDELATVNRISKMSNDSDTLARVNREESSGVPKTKSDVLKAITAPKSASNDVLKAITAPKTTPNDQAGNQGVIASSKPSSTSKPKPNPKSTGMTDAQNDALAKSNKQSKATVENNALAKVNRGMDREVTEAAKQNAAPTPVVTTTQAPTASTATANKFKHEMPISNFFKSIREVGNRGNPDVKMASGGMTASRRGDGIASRGKTRGKIC